MDKLKMTGPVLIHYQINQYVRYYVLSSEIYVDLFENLNMQSLRIQCSKNVIYIIKKEKYGQIIKS
jgi:hypothetical protein